MLSTIFNIVITVFIALVILGQVMRLCLKPKDVSNIPNLHLQKEKYAVSPEAQEVVRGEDLDPMSIPGPVLVCLSGVHCPPCSRAQATLSKFQEQYPNITIFQYYGGDDQVRVAEKVLEMERQYRTSMSHIISVIDPDIFQAYASTFGVFGIPHAVVLDKGKAVWSGNPLSTAIQPVLAGLEKKYGTGACDCTDHEDGEEEEEEEGSASDDAQGEEDEEKKKLLE